MAKEYELLAPAGNFQCLMAAVNAGCNSVYFGLQDFNMRDSAKNFRIKDIDRIRDICRKRNVKCYLTLNTIIYSNELKKVEEILKKVKGKIDGVICWDFSVISLCRKHNIPFSISTQASVSNIESAKFFKSLGAKNITLARELNLRQIKEISKITDVSVFAHGAMCVSISGRCFTSQFLYNKSANRGQCIHTCRRPYQVKDNQGNELRVSNNKIFSAKDLCSLPYIEQMKKAGIKIFKIEGRSRDPEYVDAVVRAYRKALDKKLSGNEIEEGIEELKKVYNKGFSSGFLLKIPTSDDFSKAEHSMASEKKQFIGNVIHYYAKKEVAAVKILSGSLKLNDEIFIIGKETGIIRQKIQSIEIEMKKVSEASKGQFAGIKLPKCRKNDEIYIINKRVS